MTSMDRKDPHRASGHPTHTTPAHPPLPPAVEAVMLGTHHSRQLVLATYQQLCRSSLAAGRATPAGATAAALLAAIEETDSGWGGGGEGGPEGMGGGRNPGDRRAAGRQGREEGLRDDLDYDGEAVDRAATAAAAAAPAGTATASALPAETPAATRAAVTTTVSTVGAGTAAAVTATPQAHSSPPPPSPPTEGREVHSIPSLSTTGIALSVPINASPITTTPSGPTSASASRPLDTTTTTAASPGRRQTLTTNSTTTPSSSSSSPADRDATLARERQRQLDRLRVLRAENRRLKDRQTCRHCRQRPVSLTFLPCGHFIFCQECGSTFNACPACRKTILADVKTFVS